MLEEQINICINVITGIRCVERGIQDYKFGGKETNSCSRAKRFETFANNCNGLLDRFNQHILLQQENPPQHVFSESVSVQY